MKRRFPMILPLLLAGGAMALGSCRPARTGPGAAAAVRPISPVVDVDVVPLPSMAPEGDEAPSLLEATGPRLIEPVAPTPIPPERPGPYEPENPADPQDEQMHELTQIPSGLRGVIRRRPDGTLPDGTHIIHQAGWMSADAAPGIWWFRFEEPAKANLPTEPMLLLPGPLLAGMEQAAQQHGVGMAVKFRVSGELTRYRGRNYLLVGAAAMEAVAPAEAVEPPSASVEAGS